MTQKEKTAFIVPGRGLYQFKVMPFGLCGAAASQSRLMDLVLGFDLQPHVFVYLDDVIICTEDFEKHMQLLEEVAHRLKSAGLTISTEKSKFCCQSLQYLGFVLSENGLRTNDERVKAIVQYPVPTTVKGLKRFLGMMNWLRHFIETYAERAGRTCLKGNRQD